MDFKAWLAIEVKDVDTLLDERRLAELAWNAALRLAQKECMASACRGEGSIGARHCFEIRDAIALMRTDV